MLIKMISIVPLAQIPLIPFVNSSEDVLFLLFIFCRVSGLFLVSPFLSNRSLSVTVKIGAYRVDLPLQ